jgi:hypothetical protein
MEKRKILNNILNYIGDNSSDISSQETEGKFIRDIINESRLKESLQPPDEILYKIVEKRTQKSSKGGMFLDLFGVRKFQIAGTVATLLVIISIVIRVSTGGKNNYISTVGVYKSSARGEVIRQEGYEIQSEVTGSIAIVSSEKMNNLFLKSGKWNISSDHNQNQKETWFHFPGGGLKPVGTRFNIEIQDGKAVVDLENGKIQTYRTNEKGVIQISKISEAPYKENFSGDLPVDFRKVDTIVNIANQELKRLIKNQELEKKQTNANNTLKSKTSESIYDHFIGAEVVLKDKNDRKISGVLVDIDDGKLIIKNRDEVYIVKEKNMTLIGLDVNTNRTIFDNKKNISF